MKSRVVVGKGRVAYLAGVGSPQGNDAVGWRVVDHLESRLPSVFAAVRIGQPLRLLPLLEGCYRMWIVDACRAGQAVGTINRFEWPDARVDRGSCVSGHGIGVAEVLNLAEMLGAMPVSVVLYSLEIGPESIEPEEGLSADVAAAVNRLSDRLLEELSGYERLGPAKAYMRGAATVMA
ncbi:MAG: hydrogenase maturation protease [Pirellulales bacterium]